MNKFSIISSGISANSIVSPGDSNGLALYRSLVNKLVLDDYKCNTKYNVIQNIEIEIVPVFKKK